ncbi:MAG: transglycosylase domain-containing protein [Clostridia bacterium]|nr:transglycosylase domain-containing protein [Clostridia bacterium]
MRIGKLLYYAGLTVVILTVIILLLFGALYLYAVKGVSFKSDELLFESARSHDSTAFYANTENGEDYTPILSELYGDYRKESYDVEEIPKILKDGFIAVEDREFFTHKGVNVKRTVRAALNYLAGGERQFGGSTITQQLIKNVSGDSAPTVKRKLSEILRALHIEQHYSKDEILELYLNIIPMSENTYGVGTAAKRLFGKEPYELSVAECATLIGITNAPSAYNPYTNPDRCITKRNNVLSVMHREGVIGEREYTEALSEPLTVVEREKMSDRYSSWFAEAVITDLTEDLCEAYGITEAAADLMLRGGGLSVYTTMNASAQKILEEYFAEAKNFPEEISEGLNFAMSVIDNATGDLVATVGRVGKKQGNKLLSHAELAHIPGSVLKPLGLYAPLIDEGKINWATVFDDIPTSFTETESSYRLYPRNSPNVYSGLITVKDALRLSKNTVAVRLSELRTPRAVFDTLKDEFGFSHLVEREEQEGGGILTDIAPSPMALGQLTHGATLRELTSAFSTFARDGLHSTPRTYLYVLDKDGREIIRNEKDEQELFKPTTARIMNMLLSEVVNSGTAKSLTLKERIPLAGKTGTSGSSRDKEFIGYTPYYTAGIWCGYEGGERSVSSLSKTHLDVFDEVMTLVHSGVVNPVDSFSTEGLLYLPYCRDSGKLYSTSCLYDVRGDRLEYGYFAPDSQPTGECDRHILVDFDTVGKGIAREGCPEESITRVALLNIPERNFPTEVYITDAEFVYRLPPSEAEQESDTLPTEIYPYYYATLPESSYAGITNKRKQFNSFCQSHAK